MLINVLGGRMFAKVIAFCSKRFNGRNPPSGIAYGTKLHRCINRGMEEDFNLLSQLVYHLDHTGEEEKI